MSLMGWRWHVSPREKPTKAGTKGSERAAKMAARKYARSLAPPHWTLYKKGSHGARRDDGIYVMRVYHRAFGIKGRVRSWAICASKKITEVGRDWGIYPNQSLDDVMGKIDRDFPRPCTWPFPPEYPYERFFCPNTDCRKLGLVDVQNLESTYTVHCPCGTDHTELFPGTLRCWMRELHPDQILVPSTRIPFDPTRYASKKDRSSAHMDSVMGRSGGHIRSRPIKDEDHGTF